MDTRIPVTHLSFEPLSGDNKPSDFDCGDEDLNDFIVNDALTHKYSNVAQTSLVRYEGELVAFYSLAADSLALNAGERKRVLKEYGDCVKYPEYPALKICRLGVAVSFQRRGIGTVMLLDILGYALDWQEWVGLRYLTVDAYKKSMQFYERHGFTLNAHEQLDDPEKDTVSMRFEVSPEIPLENGEPGQAV